jgi:acyl-[acyl-carrier-protein]-phospholipid O-acyltransferase/long-chain-fatty-acid--[acyl-carrier-protein] ligase
VSISQHHHLGSALFDSLRKKPFQEFICDYGLNPKMKFSRGVTLSLSLLFCSYLNKRLESEKLVGVILPPGFGGILANLSLLLSGRVPVNLNFTLGREINQEIIERIGLQTLITASKMKKKVPEFPWTNQCILIDEILKKLRAKRWLVLLIYTTVLIMPKRVRSHFNISTNGNTETALLLFTSGSAGKPKGVPLSHSNILANCKQMFALQLFEEKTRVLLNLPLFRSFGLSVGMIFSTLRGLVLVCTPNPLDSKSSIRAIREEKVEVLLGTPTFLRGYLKTAQKNDLLSVKYVVSGAEKSPGALCKQWEDFGDCEYLEGYGLTETSPAVSFNLPGNQKRKGSVGRLLGGIECRTLDPENGQITDSDRGGILCFRGPNIFNGYWEDTDLSNKTITPDGWFHTGDLGRVDRDGFLWIEGRVSRFSKIGGEMVPHSKIEDEIMNALDMTSDQEVKLVVSAVRDEQKGERMIVLSTFEINAEEIKQKLKQIGLPNLWIPKQFLTVSVIPTLGSGKIDWQTVKKLTSKYLSDQ